MTDTLAEVAVERLYAAAKETMHQPEAEFLAATIRAYIADLQSQLAAQRERDGRVRDACVGLLAFIREKYPQDFADGGRGYICPHHLAIDAALKDRP
jgi:hypothetical protein